MKIIFLDIDGPLVNHRSNAPYGNPMLMQVFDPIASGLVLRLCNDYGAKIVISSTWRYDHTPLSMRAILNNAAPGLGNKLHDKSPFTPRINVEKSRGHEIAKWLNTVGQKVESYVIFDDSSDLLEHQLPNYVHCDPYDGLDFGGYKAAACILDGRQITSAVKMLSRPKRCAGIMGSLEIVE